jgi:hypothetical protein
LFVVLLVMAPPSQELEPPAIPGRFKTHHPGPYLLFDGTLDECIQQFTAKPASQRHLYEIHTAPQQPLVSAVLSAENIVELARLRGVSVS